MNFSAHFKVGLIVLGLLCAAMAWAPIAHAKPVKKPEISDKSDLNQDQVVDIEDLVIFSSKYLELNWETVDWCAFYEAVSIEGTYAGRSTDFYRRHFGILLGFIYDYFDCDGGPLLLGIKNEPRALTRVAVDLDYSGNYYFSDPRVDSVFIYDPLMVLIGELKHLDRPMGVAIDSQGYLLVGNNGRDNIEVYDPSNGDLLASIGEGLVQMPTSITVGSNGDIYVTDSKAHRVWVFESSYVHVRTIGMPGSGDGQLKFPTDTVIVSRDEGGTLVEEVYVSDQANHRIQVFDLYGNFVRTIGPSQELSSYCLQSGFWCPNDTSGTFARLVALDVDSTGRLHVLDLYDAAVYILDPVSGEFLGSYGSYGDGAGLLRVPLDVLITEQGDAIVTDNDSAEMEFFAIP